MPGLRIALLGTPQIEVDGAPLEVDTRKAVALLAYLSVMDGPRSRDELALLLWPDYDESHGRSSLRRTLSTLRSAMGGRWLQAARDLVSLDSTATWSDVARFQELVAGTLTSDGEPPPEVGLERLREAAALYRGDFMAGFTLRDSPEFEDWQLLQAEHLRRELDTVLDDLVRAELAQGDVPAALGHAQRRLALDTLNEAAHATLMQLYAMGGDRSAALRQYRECLRVLDEELGVAPLDETTRLYEAIFAGEVASTPALPAPPADVAPSSVERVSDLPLVGRDAELSALIEVYDSLTSGGRLLVIEGEAGVGKTRLAHELLGHVRGRGGLVLEAQAYEGEQSVSYAPVVSLLRAAASTPATLERIRTLPPAALVEAARVLPELAQLIPTMPSPPPFESPAARGRFLDAVADAIATAVRGDAAGAVLVDDLHWADDSSIELLMYFARRLEGRHICLLLTWRTEEVSPSHPLRRFLAERVRAGDTTHIELGRLGADAVRQLVAAANAAAPSDALVKRLYEETEGLPFFVAQYLAAATSGNEEAILPVPQTVRDLLRTRVARVGDADLQLLTTASVIGRSFNFDVLREASGRSEDEAVAAIERLTAGSFLRLAGESSDDPAYDFTHERLRAFVYEDAGPARRRLLHRRVAEALSRDRRTNARLAGVIARHYQLAGHEEEAALAFETAAHDAGALHAHTDAIAHLRAALAAGHTDPALIHEEIGELQTLTGEYGGALVSYQTAAALAGPARLPAIDHHIGVLYIRLGAWGLADEHLATAFEGFTAGEQDGDRARTLADRSLAAHRAGRDEAAGSLAQQSLELARAAEDDRALAQSHNILGMLAGSRGDSAVAREHLRLSLALAERLDDVEARIAALNNLALALQPEGDITTARELLEAAIELCATYGDRHREAALRNNLADVLRAAGHAEDSMAQLKQAVAIFAEIGADREDAEPEIWKLVNW